MSFLSSSMEYTRLDDKKIMFALSLKHFLRILYVPKRFVLKTLSGSFFDTSIAGSAQQSIIKSIFGNVLIFLKFSIFILRFLILYFFSLFLFCLEPFRVRLSKLKILAFNFF